MRFRRSMPGAADQCPAAGTWNRRRLRDVGIIAATFAIGYVVTAVWISPGPLLPSDRAVPRVLELPATEAEGKLGELSFRVKIAETRPHPTIPRGTVIWQDPPAGVILPQRSVVRLVTSTGPLQVPVPDVQGLALADATRIITAAGLKVGAVDTIPADPEPGIVHATRPAVGTARDPGSAIELVVSGSVRQLRGPWGSDAGLRMAPLGAVTPPSVHNPPSEHRPPSVNRPR